MQSELLSGGLQENLLAYYGNHSKETLVMMEKEAAAGFNYELSKRFNVALQVIEAN